MPAGELAALIGRVREEAEGAFGFALERRESDAGGDAVEAHKATLRACDAVLLYLDAEGGETR